MSYYSSMKFRDALGEVASIAQSQWGLVTSGQAHRVGLDNMTLSRLCERGSLVRVAHGVYRVAGAPIDQWEALRAEWLHTSSDTFAFERLAQSIPSAVVSGETAAALHRMGSFRALTIEFTTAERKQTQRPGVRFRARTLQTQDVDIQEGLPVTTREKTLADLVSARQDWSLLAEAVTDAVAHYPLNWARLAELFAPLASRNGYPRGDGNALLGRVLEMTGVER